MTNLTEQWKNGELEVGEYWCKNVGDGKVYTANTIYGSELYCEALTGTLNIGYWEVLAPVPSYEEWIRTNYSLDDYKRLSNMRGEIISKMEESNEDTVKYLREENAKLKETIKRTKANGNYPSRVSAYKSRIATLCEENQKLKELLSKCVSRVDTLSDILDFLKDKVVYKQSKQLADILKSTREIIKEIDEVLK